MKVFLMILGGFMIYTEVHFFFIQHSKTWEARTKYQKAITIIAIMFAVLLLLGIMSD